MHVPDISMQRRNEDEGERIPLLVSDLHAPLDRWKNRSALHEYKNGTELSKKHSPCSKKQMMASQRVLFESSAYTPASHPGVP